MTDMMKISEDKVLDKISGGLVTVVRGWHYAVRDDGKVAAARAYNFLRDAVARAQEEGWSTEYVSEEEFERRFGHPYEP